jgi:hypothetical protein
MIGGEEEERTSFVICHLSFVICHLLSRRRLVLAMTNDK